MSSIIEEFFPQFSVIRAVGVKKILDWTLQLNNGKARP